MYISSVRESTWMFTMLFQLCLVYPPNLCCSMLLIIAHLMKERPYLLLSTPERIPLKMSKQSKESEEETEHKGENESITSGYDPHTDNPIKAGAECTLCYELHLLSRHYHPSVALFATEILQRTKKGVEYYGDPLKDFTLMHFLDRFVYRSPKAQSHEVTKLSLLLLARYILKRMISIL